MIATVTTSTRLIPHTCGDCGVIWGFPDGLRAQRMRDGEMFWCPNGHKRYFTENDTTRLEAAQARNRHLEDQLQAARDEGEKARRVLVRERARFANGVCPCCNRSFANVRRHMVTKHPDYDPSHLLPAGGLFMCTCGYEARSYHGLRTHQGSMSWGRHETKV